MRVSGGLASKNEGEQRGREAREEEEEAPRSFFQCVPLAEQSEAEKKSLSLGLSTAIATPSNGRGDTSDDRARRP